MWLVLFSRDVSLTASKEVTCRGERVGTYPWSSGSTKRCGNSSVFLAYCRCPCFPNRKPWLNASLLNRPLILPNCLAIQQVKYWLPVRTWWNLKSQSCEMQVEWFVSNFWKRTANAPLNDHVISGLITPLRSARENWEHKVNWTVITCSTCTVSWPSVCHLASLEIWCKANHASQAWLFDCKHYITCA